MDELWQVGMRIQDMRRKKGLTQVQLAEILSITTRYMGHFEQKGTSDLIWLKKIADALNVNILQLIPEEYYLSLYKVDLSRLFHLINHVTKSDWPHFIQTVEEFVSKQNNHP